MPIRQDGKEKQLQWNDLRYLKRDEISSYTGIKGDTGVQGIHGSPGSPGVTGLSIQGVTGLQGITGLRGTTGLEGSTGPAGGPQGVTGLPGVGDRNVDGGVASSVYLPSQIIDGGNA
jgi:hypothetical protein